MNPLAAFAVAGCLAVSPGADHIVFRDLIAAFPGADSVPADSIVALAPSPGIQRVFHIPELRRIALRLHVDAEPQTEVCVERPVTRPTAGRMMTAMQKALPDAGIEILDYSRQPLPEGELEFSAAGLHPSIDGAMWSGYVRYAGSRLFHTWAKVKVSGVTVGTAPAQAAAEVSRGQVVAVEVRTGAVKLAFSARAERSGARGDLITLVNTESQRRFSARVAGPGRVTVDAAGQVNR
jgi:hypothetical protein